MKTPVLVVAGAALLASALPLVGCASTPAKSDAPAATDGAAAPADASADKPKEGSCGGEKKAGEGSCGEGSCGGR